MTKLKELWVPVKGFEEYYSLSSTGKVKRVKSSGNSLSGRLLKGSVDSAGYKVFSFRNRTGKKKDWRLHRLLAEHFIQNPNDYKCIDHIDGDKANNSLSNLRWCTRGQNISWAANEQGLLDRKGENHENAKLNKFDVLKIRELAASGWTHQQIADKIKKVKRRHVTDIINRVCWKHI
jgi:hypothetical protein